MMYPEFVILKTYTYPHEAALAVALLNANDIQTHLLNELTVQNVSLHSNALGGVKLMVPASEYTTALNLLVEHHLMKAPKSHSAPYPLQKITDKWPVINQLSPPIRIVFLALILISILSVLVFYLFN